MEHLLQGWGEGPHGHWSDRGGKRIRTHQQGQVTQERRFSKKRVGMRKVDMHKITRTDEEQLRTEQGHKRSRCPRDKEVRSDRRQRKWL